jgi:hypothetical protein
MRAVQIRWLKYGHTCGKTWDVEQRAAQQEALAHAAARARMSTQQHTATADEAARVGMQHAARADEHVGMQQHAAMAREAAYAGMGMQPRQLPPPCTRDYAYLLAGLGRR